MGLFSRPKTVCSICGTAVNRGARPILNGFICGQCRSKCSPYLNHYNNMSVDEVLEHLKYREKNLADLKQFRPTKVLLAARNEDEDINGGPIYVDENRRQFVLSPNNDYIARNTDLFDYSDFKSFTYSPDDGYILMKLMAFSKACNSIIEEELEWDICVPDTFRRRPQEAPIFLEAVSIVQEVDRFFKSMTDNTIGSPGVSTANIRCPNCGAMTAISGRADNCSYCGSTIINTFYKN